MAEDDVVLSLGAEVVLWLTVFGVTLLIEFSPMSWIPAYHVTAGMCMLRLSQSVEHSVTNLALELDIELTTTVFLRRAAFWLCLSLALMYFLSSVGFETAMMVNFLTSASFAIGLASQQLLRDIAAGVMLMIWRPFKVGDLIQMEDGTVGFVFDILLTQTLVDTETNSRVSLPNSSLFGKSCVNLSRNAAFRLDVDLELPIDRDFHKCKHKK